MPLVTSFQLIGYDGPMAALLQGADRHIRVGASHAVRGIEFELNAGEVLGLVGESGSGKSATSLAIMGLLGSAAQANGSILWRGSDDLGIDLLRASPDSLRRIRGREIAMVFQEPMTSLNPGMTIGRHGAECGPAHCPPSRPALKRHTL